MNIKHTNKHAIKLFVLGIIALADVICFAGAFTGLLRDFNNGIGVISLQIDTLVYIGLFVVLSIILLTAFINITAE